MLAHKLGRDLNEGMQANHHCDRQTCVNPDHLYEGTQQENIDDAIRRGRARVYPPGPSHGEDNGMSVLTDISVLAIRALAREGNMYQREIAALFNVTQSTVSLLRRGKVWRHVKEAA